MKTKEEFTSGETIDLTLAEKNVTNVEVGGTTTHGTARNTINTHQTSVQSAIRDSTTGKWTVWEASETQTHLMYKER
jgi:hypothetical protein